MNNDQILNNWRKHLAEKLQDQYGLQEDEARMKADLWLRSVEVEPVLAAQLDRRWELRDHGIRSAKSRSAAASRR
jgi:hypothetical protein